MAKLDLNKINLIILIISFISINSQDFRILNYYHNDGKIYSIEEGEDNFKILTKEVIFCITTPCIPPVLDEKIIENKEDIRSLKLLFDEIFVDSKVKELNAIEGELADEQLEIILNVLKKNKIIIILEYKIINNLGQYNGIFRRRGYLYKIEGDSVIYTIAMGEKTSGGYSIEVKEVKIKGDSATIYVTEKSPGKEDIVTDALTYPIVQVKFNKFPSSIEVISYDSGESFPSLN